RNVAGSAPERGATIDDDVARRGSLEIEIAEAGVAIESDGPCRSVGQSDPEVVGIRVIAAIVERDAGIGADITDLDCRPILAQPRARKRQDLRAQAAERRAWIGG